MKVTSGVKHKLADVDADGVKPRPYVGCTSRRPGASAPVRSDAGASLKRDVRHPTRAPHRARAATLLTVVASAALLGCSSLPSDSWRIEPAYRVDGASVNPAEGYLALARQYEGESRIAQALEAYQSAARAAPADADVQNTLGMALARHAAYAQAVTALRRAVALAPERAQLLNNLGYALLLDGRADEARAMFRLTLAVDPAHALASRNLAYIDQQRTTTASNASPQAAATAAGVPAAVRPVAVLPVGVIPAAAVPAAVVQAPVVQAPEAKAQVVQEAAKPAAMVPTVAPAIAPTVAPAVAPTMAPVEKTVAAVALSAKLAASLPPPSPASVVAASPPLPMAVVGNADKTAAVTAARLDGVSIEIVNGNGISGAAARLRGWLKEQGVQTGRLANLLPYNSPHTQVLYRPGKGDAARLLAQRLPVGADVAPAAAGATRTDLRVLIGHDVRHSAGCAALAACAVPERLASSTDVKARR